MQETRNKTRRNYLFGAGCVATFAIGAGVYIDGAADLLQSELSSYGQAEMNPGQLYDIDPTTVLQLSGGVILAAAGLASLSRIEG